MADETVAAGLDLLAYDLPMAVDLLRVGTGQNLVAGFGRRHQSLQLGIVGRRAPGFGQQHQLAEFADRRVRPFLAAQRH